jgi:hypothetical protein
MRKLILLFAFVPCAVILAGCPKKDGAADAAAEAAAETPSAAAADAAAPTAAPAAKNEKDIARFPSGETAIANETAKILSYTVARTQPRGGGNVGSPKIGGDVTKIASYNDVFLIVFPDPKDATSNLMGWVGKEAFVVTITDASIDRIVVDAAKPLTCGAGLALVTLGGDPICKKTCKTDKDCKNPTAGACGVAAAATGAAKALHVCINE